MDSKNTQRLARDVVYSPTQVAPSRLNVELALWMLVASVAWGLRLFHLEAGPLSLTEAQNSLAAWRFVGGGGAYSPALFTGQTLLFVLFGSSDFAARFWPALAGGALALSPWLLRRQIGRVGALAAGTMLALSPTAVVLSRSALGDVFVALGSLLVVGGLWRYVQDTGVTSNAKWPLVALGLALALAAGPLVYSALIALVVALVLLLAALRSADSGAYRAFCGAWERARRDDPANPLGSSHLKLGLGLFAASLLLASTAFMWNLSGLGALADLLVQWLGGFVIWPDDLGWSYPFTLLLTYEPLILAMGFGGVLLAVLRARPISLFLVLWAANSLTLAFLRSGHGPGDVLLVLLPLACLGGMACDGLLNQVYQYARWRAEGLVLAASVPLWTTLFFRSGEYVLMPFDVTHLSFFGSFVYLSTKLNGIMLVFVLFVLLFSAFVLLLGNAPTLRGGALSLLCVLILFTWSAAWGSSQTRPADPKEVVHVEPTAPDVRLLVRSLEKLSNDWLKHVHSIDLTVQVAGEEEDILAWYLRDFEAQFVKKLDPATIGAAVITREPSPSPRIGAGYIGQRFALQREWRAVDLGCKSTKIDVDLGQEAHVLDCSRMLRWLLYRSAPEKAQEQVVILWVREDLWPSAP